MVAPDICMHTFDRVWTDEEFYQAPAWPLLALFIFLLLN